MQAARQDQTVFSPHWLEQLFKERTVQRGEDYQVVGYDVVSGIPMQNINIARVSVEKSLRTIDNLGLDQFLMKLWLTTQAENLGEHERTLKFQAYKEILVNYPNDLLDSFAKAWPQSHKFFPKTAEIIEAIDPEFQQRKMKLKALEDEIARSKSTKIAQSQKLGDLQTIWIKTKEELRKWDAFMVKQWFDPLIVAKKEGSIVTLRANSSFELEWVGTKYLDKIADTWIKIDPSTTQIEVTL